MAKTNKSHLIPFILLVGLFAFMMQGVCESYDQDKIVAIVNNDVITDKDLNEFINFTRIQLSAEYSGKELESKIQSMKLDLLDRLISDRLVLQEAKKEGLIIDESRVKQKINDIKKRYQTDTEFQNALVKQGITQADIETKIKEQFMVFSVIDSKIRKKIIVTPGEVTEFYKQHSSEFVLDEEREFDSLTVEDAKLANTIYNNLKKGQKTIEEVAKEYSLSVNRMVGGSTGQLRKEIEDAVFKLNPQEVAPPVLIDSSYYIIVLNKIIPAHKESLVQAQERISTFIFEQKSQDELDKWLNEIRKNSYVKIL